MRVLKSILWTIAAVMIAGLTGLLLDRIRPLPSGRGEFVRICTVLMVLGTSLWASIASYRLEFRKYKTGMPYHPVTIFLLHVLCWILAFPFFLTAWQSIRSGEADVKDEFKPKGPIVPAGLSKAWSPTLSDDCGGTFPVPPTGPLIRTEPPPLRLPPVLSPPPKVSSDDRLAQLQKLADFKAQGILTDEEFQVEKRRLLD